MPAWTDRGNNPEQKLIAVISLLLSALALANGAAAAADRGPGFAGVEFLGSSLLSRVELDKDLKLRPGAPTEAASKALERLKVDFDKRALKTNVDFVFDGAQYFISVDVIESSSQSLPNRHLEHPEHVGLPNEKPFVLLEELKARLQKLADEGKQVSESYKDGVKVFSDFACNRTAELLAQELSGEKPYLFRILATDPNNERRASAVELLNWTNDPVRNCFELIPALDDSDMHVRTAAAKYIWARIQLLPDDFPFDPLLEGLSRELTRPSHFDRVIAMAALLALAQRNSDIVGGIKSFDETKLRDIANGSIIPHVQNLAKQLVGLCQNPPPMKQRQKRNSVDMGGF